MALCSGNFLEKEYTEVNNLQEVEKTFVHQLGDNQDGLVLSAHSVQL